MPICESQFLETVQEVRNICTQVPEEAHIHDRRRDRACDGRYSLPHIVEYQLAQDLAFIAAHEEGVHTVSAATVKEAATEQGLTFNMASNSGIGLFIGGSIFGIGRYLERYTRKGNVAVYLSGNSLRSFICNSDHPACLISVFKNGEPLLGTGTCRMHHTFWYCSIDIYPVSTLNDYYC